MAARTIDMPPHRMHMSAQQRCLGHRGADNVTSERVGMAAKEGLPVNLVSPTCNEVSWLAH